MHLNLRNMILLHIETLFTNKHNDIVQIQDHQNDDEIPEIQDSSSMVTAI